MISTNKLWSSSLNCRWEPGRSVVSYRTGQNQSSNIGRISGDLRRNLGQGSGRFRHQGLDRRADGLRRGQCMCPYPRIHGRLSLSTICKDYNHMYSVYGNHHTIISVSHHSHTIRSLSIAPVVGYRIWRPL